MPKRYDDDTKKSKRSRYQYVHGAVRSTVENPAGKNRNDSGRIGREERSAEKYSVQLGGCQKIALNRTIPATCGISRGYSAQSNAPKIIFGEFSKKYPIGNSPLLHNTQSGIIISFRDAHRSERNISRRSNQNRRSLSPSVTPCDGGRFFYAL